MAPAFGEDDNRVCQKYDVPFVQFVDGKGEMTKETKQFMGLSTEKANPVIIDDLDKKGLLFDTPMIEHSYPFCWRCNTPLIYYARETWFIKMSAIKDKLIKNNNTIHWYPENVGKGRFGDWLLNVQDWGVSRNRYWGTPLNIWECECGHREAIGSKSELKEKAIDLKEDVELHRPFVDKVHIKCEKCGKKMTRVSEVIDCWFDSGAMPYAQHHYPFENKELFEKQFPADFICEAVDQTRGWFYSLLAESTILFDKAPFKNCLVLGHVTDKNGQKMSKSKGNAIDPMDALNKYGADAIRWFFYTNSAPWLPKRFHEDAVKEGQNKFLGTLQNVYAFFVLYANIDNFNPNEYTLDIDKLNVMDRWLISKLNILIKNVTKDLENYKITESANKIQKFVDELSNWYIRRNRERFWASGMEIDKINAYMVLYNVLLELSKIIAPFVPFISEEIYTNLYTSINNDNNISVHLCDYPVCDDNVIDYKLEEKMEEVIKIVELGRTARNDAKIKNRQPISQMFVKSDKTVDDFYIDIIKNELNVKQLIFKTDLSDYISYIFKPQLKTLGPKYGKNLSKIKMYLENVNSYETYMNLKKDGFIEFKIDENDIKLFNDDLIIEATKKGDYITAIDGITTVVLDTALNDELIEEGYIREIISKIQTMRKENNFEIMDKIDVYISGNDKLVKIVSKWQNVILKDIMSKNLYLDKKTDTAIVKVWDINDEKLTIGICK